MTPTGLGAWNCAGQEALLSDRTVGVIELFAGPGGGSEGVGGNSIGLEWDATACATARAAGHRRVLADVSRVDPGQFAVEHRYTGEGHLDTPPCQGFTVAGKGLGRADAPHVLSAVQAIGDGVPVPAALETLRERAADHRTALVLEPLRWSLALRPGWVICEQVPAVLPLWEACGEVLRGRGYNVWTGILHAEQYGVPQARKRAILMARLGAPVAPPAPTHSRYYPTDPGRTDPGLPRPVSQADAIGWGMTHRPSMTVTAGGTATGGAEPFGNAARQGMRRQQEAGLWLPRPDGSDGLRITPAEAGVLQSFPEGYPWQGNLGQQFRQAGDAVPPLLVAHIAAALGAGVLAGVGAAA